jgi:hypothetical protein
MYYVSQHIPKQVNHQYLMSWGAYIYKQTNNQIAAFLSFFINPAQQIRCRRFVCFMRTIFLNFLACLFI